jgi:hypothetical protein
MTYRTFILAFVTLALYVDSTTAQIPAMNQQIKDYVSTVIGTKVGRGECWDLANEALEGVGAEWNGMYVFGKVVVPGKDSIYPGDVLQFENVKLEYRDVNDILTETYPHHTAIVYEVLGPKTFRIAHQNTGFSGRKVGLSLLRLDDKKSGKITFYRPQAGK